MIHDLWLKEGIGLSGEKARLTEAMLLTSPNDLACRLRLIGYYDLGNSDSDGAFPHLLWLIDNHLEKQVCYYLRLDKRFSTAQLKECCERLMHQVSISPSNDSVIGNVASIIASIDSDLSERLFQCAQDLNPRDPRWTRRLADIYRHKAIYGAPEIRTRCAQLAVAETEKALALRDTLGEHVGLLLTVTPIAIEFRFLDEALTWSERLLRVGRKHEYPLWEESACIYRARVELAKNKLARSKIWLKKALKKIKEDPDYAVRSNRLMVLLNELLGANEAESVKYALQVLIRKSPSNERIEFEDWLRQLDAGGKPTLSFLN